TGQTHGTHGVAATPTISATARHGQLPAAGQTERATAADERAGLTTYYQVKPPQGRHYDTLWDIADRYLGNGLRYKELVELNRGLHQADGTELSNPDLIYPGWILRMPADAVGPGLRVVDHAGALPQVVPSLAGESGGIGGAAGLQRLAAEPTSPHGPDGVDAVRGVHLDAAWSPLFGVAGGLALGGAALALRRRRAARPLGELWGARLTGVPAGPAPDDPDGGPGSGGPAPRLRDEAEPGLAAWFDRALRSSGIGLGVPAPTQVSVGPTGLAMLFAGPTTAEPPAGWTRINERVWVVGTDAALPGGGPAPCPGLVAVGKRPDGSLLLVDPEAVPGVVSLEGDEDVARGLAMSLAIDTATHPWADRRTVTLVGFAGDLTGIDGEAVHRADDIGRVLEELENQARYYRGVCRQVGAHSAREARVGSPGTADWAYHLVICSGLPSLTELSRLHALASDPQVPLGVVVIGTLASADLRLAARADGRLTSPLHAIDVEAQQVGADAVAALADLFRSPAAAHVTLEEWAAALADPPAYATATEAAVRIGVLGPVEVHAPGDVDPDRVAFLTELAAYLALHPGGVHVNRLSAAMWPRGVEAATRNAALRQLDAWLGSAPDAPVLVEDDGVWSLRPDAVVVDWDELRGLVNAAGERPSEAERLLVQALGLVRGRPFSGAADGRYAWLETTTLETDTALAVGLVTLATAERAASRGDADAARDLLGHGLETMPANEDLWRARLRLEATYGDDGGLREVADALYRTLAEEGSYGASGETDALVAELIPGYRSAVA
ncbi:MAG TPA: LysM peptidoglycan-binding domain-containing protein, partial [Nocardioides sp.]|nr:LysM peptidoglycan-binding domain-containing protein [Nocardioides sp.]